METSKPPGIGTALSSGKAGAGAAESGFGLTDLLALTDTLLDVLTGWYQEIVEPEAYGYTRVAFHTQHYPKYTYEGTVSVTHYYNDESTEVTEKDRRNQYSISSMSQILTARGNWNVRLILNYENDLQGAFLMYPEETKASLQVSENYRQNTKFVNFCLNGNAPSNTETKSTRQGSDSVESGWGGRLERSKNKNGGFSFELSGNVSSHGKAMVTLNHTSIHTVSDKCSALVPGTHVTVKTPFKSEIDDRVYPKGFQFKMDSKEEYPKTINGSAVTKGTNSESLWTFTLKRIDPVAKNKK